MDFCKVTAIIRGEKVKQVEEHLVEHGACGMTVTQVKGCGEWMDFFKKDWLVTHARIEIFTAADKADELARAIMDVAHTGEVGDGIIAVLPVNRLYRIRNKSAGVPENL